MEYNNPNRALVLAASSGWNDWVIEILRQKNPKANIDFQGAGGQTPLHRAASNGKWKTINYLLDKGANPAIKDDEGKAALYYARLCIDNPNETTGRLERAGKECGE